MATDRLQVQEEEPKGAVEITRLEIVRHNRFGRPLDQEIESQTFSNLEDAFEWIIKGQNYTHSIQLPWGTEVSAKLEDDEKNGGERLVLNAFGETGSASRSVEGHHGVSTDYETFFNLVVTVGQRKDPVFDRGVVWVNVFDPHSPKLSVTLMPNKYNPEQLRDNFARMTERVVEVFRDILKNKNAS